MLKEWDLPGKARVHELAKELGVDSKTVLAKLKEMGEFVKSASSTVEASTARRLRGELQHEPLARSIRSAIVTRRFEQAERDLQSLRNTDAAAWDTLRSEIGGLIEQRHAPGGAGQRRIDWLTGIWAATAATASPSSSPPAKIVARSVPPSRPAGLSPGRRPEAIGRQLEEGFLGVLTELFALSEADLVRLRRQGSGTQFGHDIEFDADTRTGRVRCHVECKNYRDKVRIEDLAPKLLQQLVYWENKPVDYFILISPRAGAHNELSRLVQDCNYGGKLPFKVLLWGLDEQVDELFQLTPKLYQQLYGRRASALTGADRAAIARRWQAKLPPTVRLAESWQRYLSTPALHQLYGEPDFESVRQDAIRLGTLADTGAPMPGTLHENVRDWLNGRQERTLLLLADFGDGKSFFGYELGLSLASEFLEDPSGWVPLRIPLRALREDSQPATLLTNRLAQIGVSVSEWAELARQRRTLVVLDGFDEMSAQLDPQTLKRNIDVLAACIDHFPDSKVLVTSRTHFFGHLSDHQKFQDALGGPRLLRIAPIPLRERLAHLSAYAERIGQRAKFERLTKLYDPIGLAAKPLFLQMIKETLPTLPDDHFNEVVLYQQYIRDSIERKIGDLQRDARMDKGRLIENLGVILEELAVRLHMSRTDYVNLRDFDTDRREGLSELLWAMSGASPDTADSTPDARSRIGVRSLLKPVAGVDPDRWPVDFFHRSMREFFVARALVRAVANQHQVARDMLTDVPLQPEIVDFVRLIMQKPAGIGVTETPAAFIHKLISHAKSAVRPLYDHRHLGGNALTLVFALQGQVPRTDWSGLALDYADLSGAVLDGLSFRGSSLRQANLDNTSLIETDLRGTDLTGVQLEQTTPVVTLTFDPDTNTAYAVYGDRSLRRWDLSTSGRMTCTKIVELDLQPTGIHLSPFGDLIIQAERTIAVLSPLGADGDWQIVARFPTLARAPHLAVKGNQVILGDREEGWLKRYDPVSRAVRAEILVPGEGFPSALLGDDAIIAARRDGLTITVAALGRTLQIDRPTCMDTRVIGDERCLLALGYQDGTVRLLSVEHWHQEPLVRPIWSRQVHAGSVTDVRLSGMFVLSGGMDRTICLFALTDDWTTGEPLRLHRTLACDRMKIDGVEGPQERTMLQAILKKAPPDRETAPATIRPLPPRRPILRPVPAERPPNTRAVPTPRDVFGRGAIPSGKKQ